MSPVAALMGLAGATAVIAIWELAGTADDLIGRRRARELLRPLQAAGAVGRTPTPDERRRLAITGAVVLLAGGWLLAGPLPGLLAATAGPHLVRRLIAARRRRWRRELAGAAPLVSRALADALAGGHSIRGAVAQAASGVVEGAAGAELATTAHALELGERTEVALEHLRRRARSREWDALVAAVLMQREAGGDLAALLRGLAGAQEEAGRAEADARAATAQARFTTRLVAALPVGAALLAELASPGLVASVAGSALGLMLLALSALLTAMALVLVGRIARVRC